MIGPVFQPGTFKDETGSTDVVVNYGMYASRFPTYGELLSVCPTSSSCPTWIRGTYWTSSPYNTSNSITNLSYMNNSNLSYNSYSKTGGYRPVITLPRAYFNK